MSRSRAFLVSLLLAPVPAATLGLVVMSRWGVPAAIRMQNLSAMALCVLVVVPLVVNRAPSRAEKAPLRWLVALGIVLLGATLMAPGASGVHRWLGVGPVAIHVGAVVLPSVLVFLASLEGAEAFGLAVVTLALLLVQPDAAQAASFGAGWAVFLAMSGGRAAAGQMAVALTLGGAAFFRLHPLEPVPYVEGIVGVAVGLGPIWAVACLGALALLPIPFLLAPQRKVGGALAIYMAGTLVAPWLGDYPVPILGHGVSPILGYYLVVVALRFSGQGAFWGESPLAVSTQPDRRDPPKRNAET